MNYQIKAKNKLSIYLFIVCLGSIIYPHSVLSAETETRIYTFPSCPATGPQPVVKGGAIAPILIPIISAAVAPLIESLVDKGVEAIKNAAQDKDFPLSPPVPIQNHFYEIGPAGETQLNRMIQCVVVVRGSFNYGIKAEDKTSSSSTLADRVLARFRVPDPDSDPQSPGANSTFLDKVDFYFETSLVISDNGQSFAFRPQALYVDDFASNDGFWGPSQRQYSVTITFTDTFSDQPFASAQFKFEGLERKHSEMECLGMTPLQYCSAVKLGGLHGWYATKPSSTDIIAQAQSRQELALRVLRAVTPWQSPEYTSVPEDMPMTAAANATYCAEIKKAEQSDASCPPELTNARRQYTFAKLVDAGHLEKLAADKFWGKQCASFSRDEKGAAKCLLELAKGKPATAGKFVINATITETRPGNKVAKFFAPVAQNVAPKLKEALIKELDPAERQKAKDQQQLTDKASRASRLKATETEMEARIAQIEYDKALSDLNNEPTNSTAQVAALTKQMDLLKKQTDANEAARSANVPPPFPNVE